MRPLRWLLSVLGVPIVLGVLPVSRAEASLEPEPGHYGWQTATGDGFAVVLTIMGLVPASNDRQVAVVAIGGSALYLFTAPTIHLLHDNPRGAARSVLTRLILPVAGGALIGLGLHVRNPCGGQSGESGHTCRDSVAIVGGVLAAAGGVVAASIIDATWFARSPTAPATTWHVAPTVARDGVILTLVGAL